MYFIACWSDKAFVSNYGNKRKKERKKERKYITPDVVCIECELESAILYGSEVGSQMDPGESEDGCIGDDL